MRQWNHRKPWTCLHGFVEAGELIINDDIEYEAWKSRD